MCLKDRDKNTIYVTEKKKILHYMCTDFLGLDPRIKFSLGQDGDGKPKSLNTWLH